MTTPLIIAIPWTTLKINKRETKLLRQQGVLTQMSLSLLGILKFVPIYKGSGDLSHTNKMTQGKRLLKCFDVGISSTFSRCK